MSVSNKKELLNHLGHEIEVAYYGNEEDPASVTIECLDCCEVLVCFEDEEDTEQGPQTAS